MDRVSTTLIPGVTGLLGANGAGKTTLMRMVCDVLRPTSGQILLDGTDAGTLGDEYRAMLGYLPQDFGYYPDFTALDFMRYMATLKGFGNRDGQIRSMELLEEVGLASDARRKIKTFSGGMKQRLGIAQAMINDPAILPKYAILDPELTMGLPPFVTATTGMDALCHAVEAYTNHTYNTPLENKLAKEAVQLIHENLLKAYHDGSDLEARQNMQRAAFFAGRAFTRGCVGYVHATGHTLGGLYGVPHGLAMSIILPHVMRQFGAAVHDKLADLADVCGIGGADKAEKAENFIRWIEDMKREMDIPVGADMIRDEDVEQIIT